MGAELLVLLEGIIDSSLSLPQMGEKGGGEKAIFYNFFNFIYSEISKKIGFRGSAFPFPPFSLLRTGKKMTMN